MGSSPTVKRFLVFVGFFLPMAFLLLLLSGAPSVARAADYTVTGGIVERVSGTVVTLEGNSYDVAGSPGSGPLGEGNSLYRDRPGKESEPFRVEE